MCIRDRARTIRIPVHMVETIHKLGRVSRQLSQELGKDPTPEQIAQEMNMPVDKVREIMKISQDPVSLETPVGEEEDSHIGEDVYKRQVLCRCKPAGIQPDLPAAGHYLRLLCGRELLLR